jgi:hypothetical protein
MLKTGTDFGNAEMAEMRDRHRAASTVTEKDPFQEPTL